MNKKQLLEHREKLLAELKEVSEQIHLQNSKTVVFCENNNFGKGCGKGTQIRNIEYIQTHWYVTPHGCTGGDYWKEDEGQWECPKCGHINRLYNKPEIEQMKRLFKSIRNVHEH